MELVTMRRILLALFALLFATQVFAAEHVGSLGTLTLPAGATFDGTTIHVTTPQYGTKIFKLDPTVLGGKPLAYHVTLANVTAGSASVYANGVKSMACTGAWVNADNGWHGMHDIPDNFDSSQAIISAASIFPTSGIDQREPDQNGSFRYIAQVGNAKFIKDDPMVCPHQPGASHAHQVWCNTGFNANSTYQSLRTTGGTTCGDPRHPLQRSAIWQPAMEDGFGNYIEPFTNLEYYKTIPPGFAECVPPGGTYTVADTTKVGFCIPLPNGIRWVSGFDMGTMLHGPTDSSEYITDGTGSTYNPHFTFACRDSFRATGGDNNLHFHDLDQAYASGKCTVGKVLYYTADSPFCWDGLHVDSPDHRSHLVYAPSSIPLSEAGTRWVGNEGTNTTPAGVGDTVLTPANWPKCPVDHPYLIPTFNLQEAWLITPSFPYWHFSSDEQVTMAMPRGASGHMDYWAAWSLVVWPKIEPMNATTGCISGRNSGNGGLACDGTIFSYMKGFTPESSGNNPYANNTPADITTQNHLVPRTRVGEGVDIRASGTYNGVVKPLSGGELGIYLYSGFVGDITVFTMTDQAVNGQHSGVTVTTP
jgi:hypothetical protein